MMTSENPNDATPRSNFLDERTAEVPAATVMNGLDIFQSRVGGMHRDRDTHASQNDDRENSPACSTTNPTSTRDVQKAAASDSAIAGQIPLHPRGRIAMQSRRRQSPQRPFTTDADELG